jgi:hypothetical protein
MRHGQAWLAQRPLVETQAPGSGAEVAREDGTLRGACEEGPAAQLRPTETGKIVAFDGGQRRQRMGFLGQAAIQGDPPDMNLAFRREHGGRRLLDPVQECTSARRAR